MQFQVLLFLQFLVPVAWVSKVALYCQFYWLLVLQCKLNIKFFCKHDLWNNTKLKDVTVVYLETEDFVNIVAGLYLM